MIVNVIIDGRVYEHDCESRVKPAWLSDEEWKYICEMWPLCKKAISEQERIYEECGEC